MKSTLEQIASLMFRFEAGMKLQTTKIISHETKIVLNETRLKKIQIQTIKYNRFYKYTTFNKN